MLDPIKTLLLIQILINLYKQWCRMDFWSWFWIENCEIRDYVHCNFTIYIQYFHLVRTCLPDWILHCPCVWHVIWSTIIPLITLERQTDQVHPTMLHLYTDGDGYFQSNNAHIYFARIVCEWLEEHNRDFHGHHNPISQSSRTCYGWTWAIHSSSWSFAYWMHEILMNE